MKARSIVDSANEGKIGDSSSHWRQDWWLIQIMKTRSEYDLTDEDKIASDYLPKARSLKNHILKINFIWNVWTTHHSRF